MADTPKNDHWQYQVLTDTGVTPGTYGPAQITVGADGRITSASNSVVSTVSTVSTLAQLPTIIGPSNGDLAIVLDDGSGNEEQYVWNASNSDLGAPQNRWRRIGSTATQSIRTDYRQAVINTTNIQNLSTAIPNDGIIKEVNVVITTPYSLGASIEIQNTAAYVFMPFASVNPQLAGTYRQDLSGNLVDMVTSGSGQLRAIVGGAPGAGAGVVYVKWISP